MTTGDIVAIVAVAITLLGLIVGWIGSRFKDKNEQIKLLQAKNEALEKANSKLELQNLKLEITGQAVTKFFQQLPKTVWEAHEESPNDSV
jgi:cell division protein FtsB